MHVFLWDRSLFPVTRDSSRFRMAHSPPAMALGPEAHLSRQPNKNQVQPLPLEISDDDIVINDKPQYRIECDTAGEVSFRFHDFAAPNNWV
ncbi:hypothetical protein NL676_004407 [Syzygium grande]|nr:hypothetical protein NL676_004407 [Syzygium grande]